MGIKISADDEVDCGDGREMLLSGCSNGGGRVRGTSPKTNEKRGQWD